MHVTACKYVCMHAGWHMYKLMYVKTVGAEAWRMSNIFCTAVHSRSC